MPGTTPVYGFPYPEPTDLVADYPALGQDLAEDIEAVLPTIGGLAPATPTSIANSGGTATLSGNTVTFTTVNSVSLNGCFSGDYDNYRLIFRSAYSAAGTTARIRLRVGGTDDSSNNYTWQTLYATSTTVAASSTTTTSGTFADGHSTNDGNSASVDIFRPYLAAITNWQSQCHRSDTYMEFFTGLHNVATSYTGLTILVATGTITGTVSVYGYKK